MMFAYILWLWYNLNKSTLHPWMLQQYISWLIFILSVLSDSEDRNSVDVTRGRFGHAAVLRDETTLLIVGGFNGVTLGDIVAFKMPGSVAINPATSNQSLDLCGYHTR